LNGFLFKLVRLFRGERSILLGYLARGLAVAIVAAGSFQATGSWQSAYVAAVAASMVIFGWGLLAVAGAWIVWLPLAVGEELRGGDAAAHSLILLTALLLSIARPQLERALRTQLAEGGELNVRARWTRRRLAPAARVAAAAAAAPLALLRAALRLAPRYSTAVRGAAVAVVFAVVLVIGDDLLVEVTGKIPLASTYHAVNPIQGGDVVMAVAAALQTAVLAVRTGRPSAIAESLKAILSSRSQLVQGAGARLRLLVLERSAVRVRASTMLVAFMFVLAMWSDPMVALAAAATVGVAVFRLRGRDVIGLGLALLLLAGVLVVIERPGLIDRPRLANHAATGAYLLLSLGVLFLIYEEGGLGGRAASLVRPLRRLGNLLRTVAGGGSSGGEQPADGTTR
jgi:hypothetical protein